MELLLLLLSVPGLLASQCGQAEEQPQPGRERYQVDKTSLDRYQVDKTSRERYQVDKTSLDRVVNGQAAVPNSIPWQAWLVKWKRFTKGTTLLGLLMELIGIGAGVTSSGQCGGSLISNFYAHCVTNVILVERVHDNRNLVFMAILR